MDFHSLNIRRMSELDRLPWFEKDGFGALQLKESAGLPPILDVHAHVGWSYGFSDAIDHERRPTLKYLYDYEVDQDVLFECNHPLEEEKKILGKEMSLSLFALAPSSKTHTAANLLDEMKRFNHQRTCLLPIEGPIGSRHADDTMAAAKMSDKFIPLAGVYPWPWGPAKERRLEALLAHGAKALKYHPEFQFMAPDNPHAMKLFALCEEKNIAVLAHCGSTGAEPRWLRDKSEPERFRPMLEAFPRLRVLLAHTGLKRWQDTLALAKQYEERVWVDISGQPVPSLKTILDGYDKSRICYGSDWPFYPLPVALGRALTAVHDRPEYWPDFFCNNATRFLGLESDSHVNR